MDLELEFDAESLELLPSEAGLTGGGGCYPGTCIDTCDSFNTCLHTYCLPGTALVP